MASSPETQECSFCLIQDPADPKKVQNFGQLSGRSREYFASGFCSLLNLPGRPYQEEIQDLPFCLSCFDVIRSASFITRKLNEFQLKAIETRNGLEGLIVKGQLEASSRATTSELGEPKSMNPLQYSSFNFRQKIIARLKLPLTSEEEERLNQEVIEIEEFPIEETNQEEEMPSQESYSESNDRETSPLPIIRLVAIESPAIKKVLLEQKIQLRPLKEVLETQDPKGIHVDEEDQEVEFPPNPPTPPPASQSDEDFFPNDSETDSDYHYPHESSVKTPRKGTKRPICPVRRSTRTPKLSKLSPSRVEELKREAMTKSVLVQLKRVDEMSKEELEKLKTRSKRRTRPFIRKSNHSSEIKFKIHLDSRYECLACGKLLLDKKAWGDHIWVHQPVKLECPVCLRNMNYPRNLRRHLAIVHREKNNEKYIKYMKEYVVKNPKAPGFRLPRNNLDKNRKSQLTPEEEDELDQRSPCPECGRAVKKRNFESHMLIHTERNFPCDICGKPFVSLKAIEAHKRVVHTSTNMMNCEYCGLLFKNLSNLKAHIEAKHEPSNRPGLKCDQCEFIAFKPYTLERHKRSHSNLKFFHCSIENCTKSYKHKDELTVHMRAHTGERPFVCTTCGRGFQRGQLLRVHEQIHSKVKGYICPLCEKGFNVYHYLYVHVRKHKEEDEQNGIQNSPAIEAMMQISRSRAKTKALPKFNSKKAPRTRTKEEPVENSREKPLKGRGRGRRKKKGDDVEQGETFTVDQDLVQVETIEYEFEIYDTPVTDAT